MITKLAVICALAAVFPADGLAQTAPQAAASAQARTAAAQAQVTALRDSFVKATVTAGFTCPIAPPRIVMRDVPSYGNYD